MQVLIAERKGVPDAEARAGRTPFPELLRTCTVLMIGCPLDEESRNMFTEIELQQMRRDSIVINVARGGVMDEGSLVKALEEGWISSAATDVFALEPATLTSTPLITNCPQNLTLSPHCAWYADSSIETLQALVKTTLESYIAGRPCNVVKGSWLMPQEATQVNTMKNCFHTHSVAEVQPETS